MSSIPGVILIHLSRDETDHQDGLETGEGGVADAGWDHEPVITLSVIPRSITQRVVSVMSYDVTQYYSAETRVSPLST